MLVNGLEWKIKFTNSSDNLSINGIIHLGVTDRNNLTVYIDDRITGSLLRKVLIHELTHIWIFSYGYELTLQEEEFLCSFVDTYAEDIISNTDRLLFDLSPVKFKGV